MADGGVGFEVTPESATAVGDYLEGVRVRILGSIKQGMQEAMEGLAAHTVDKLHGSPIQSRSGTLADVILNSPTTWEFPNKIVGTIDTDTNYAQVGGKGYKHLGIWLEYGITDPALRNGEATFFRFTASDGQSVYTHGHGAFRVAPHPFLIPSLEEYGPTILELIQARVAEAVNA